MGTDNAKDVRQAEGMNVFTQSATKYVDNIIEAFIDKTDTITGEDLEVATRSGKVYDANPFARIFGITVKLWAQLQRKHTLWQRCFLGELTRELRYLPTTKRSTDW